jgi:hypothetical protein
MPRPPSAASILCTFDVGEPEPPVELVETGAVWLRNAAHTVVEVAEGG